MIWLHYAAFALWTFVLLIIFSDINVQILLFVEKHFKAATTNVFVCIGCKILSLLFMLVCSVFWSTTMIVLSFGDGYRNIIRSIRQHVKSRSIKAFALTGCTIIGLTLTVVGSIFWPIPMLISIALD